MTSEAENDHKKVFISYAHESGELRKSVWQLAQWLCHHDCEVWTDHRYENRPPEKGWIAWMEDCIAEAEIVLVVCTPKVKDRWEKRENPDFGRGATFEGAIAAQHLYDNAMRNNKVFPIMPDGGRYDDVPVNLRAWWNSHSFPSGNERIRCLIFDELANYGPSDGGSSSDWAIGDDHRQFSARLLAATGARPLLEAIRAELRAQLNVQSVTDTPQQLVDYFADAKLDDEELRTLFDIVHASLKALDNHPTTHAASRREAEEAAAALYCLAACRQVDRSAHNQGEYLVRVPRAEPVIYAVITAALFGGALLLRTGEKEDVPRGECVFEVHVPSVGRFPDQDFERALYVAVFRASPGTTEVARETGPLTPDQRADLLVALRNFRRVDKKAVALIIEKPVDGEPYRDFAREQKVPVMLPDETAGALLRIEPTLLRAHIRRFWGDLQVYKGAVRKQSAAS